MTKNARLKLRVLRAAAMLGLVIPYLASQNLAAQDPASAEQSAAQPLNATGATGAAPQPGSKPPTNATGGVAEIERIIVTGSNIPTAQEVGPNPVLNINRDLINKSGKRTAEDLITDLPVANAGGVPISNNATGFTPGASAISLRGLGPQYTLALPRLTARTRSQVSSISNCGKTTAGQRPASAMVILSTRTRANTGRPSSLAWATKTPRSQAQ